MLPLLVVLLVEVVVVIWMPLLLRLRLAAGPAFGTSSPRPFAVFSRPCLRVRGEFRGLYAVSSSLAFPFADDVFPPEFGPKKGTGDDKDGFSSPC